MLSLRPQGTNFYVTPVEFLRLDGQGETYHLEAAATGDGRLVFDPNGGKGGKGEIYPEYHHRDHLGNTRVAFTDRDEDGKVELLGTNSEVVQHLDYYPFGMTQDMSCLYPAGGSDNRYRYNGKEFSDEIGLYDYGARWYDPAIGRFTSVDPLAENRVWMNPYNYVQNNPISRIDPDGLTDYTVNDGKIEKVEGTGNNEGPDRLIRGRARYKTKTGELKNKDFIEIDKGSLDNLENNEDQQIAVLESGENAENIFDFVTQGTDVETEKIQLTTGDGDEQTHLVTSFDTKKVEGGTEYLLGLQDADPSMTLIDITHNHGDPDILLGREGSSDPSTPDKNKAAFLTQVRFAHQKRLPTFHIRRNGKDYPYKQLGPNQKNRR